MSLMLTHIDSRGIVHAADSNLTSGSGVAAGIGTKVFDLPYLRAGLSLTGSYSVNGVAIDKWMPQVIADYGQNASPSLSEFTDWLRGRLEREMTPTEKDGGCLIHVAGFAPDPASQHPEFHFIRNITGIDAKTGSYLGMGPTFKVTEDFWTRDCSTASARAAFAAGTGSALYINGFPSGRIAYLGLMPHLRRFLEEAWGTTAWRFRPPKTLDEVAVLVELHISVIGAMFLMSDYSAPVIGGPVQKLLTRP